LSVLEREYLKKRNIENWIIENDRKVDEEKEEIKCKKDLSKKVETLR